MPKERKTDLDLPPRCYRLKSGKITYMHKGGGKHTFHDLGKNPSPAAIQDALAILLNADRPYSLKTLAKNWMASPYYEVYAPRTRKDHQRYLRMLLENFEKADFRRVEPRHIQAWLEKRGAIARDQANKQLSFLRLILEYATAGSLLRANPAKSVHKIPEPPAEKKAKRKAKVANQVTDAKYAAMYALGPDRIKFVMEMCYCTGMRIGDLRTLKKADIVYYAAPVKNVHGCTVLGVLMVDEGKTYNEYMREITPRVDAALKLSLTFKGSARSANVLCTEDGREYTADGWSTNWQYWQKKLPPALQFSVHQLKAKAITDWKGSRQDKQLFSMHKSAAMVGVYDLGLKQAPSHG